MPQMCALGNPLHALPDAHVRWVSAVVPYCTCACYMHIQCLLDSCTEHEQVHNYNSGHCHLLTSCVAVHQRQHLCVSQTI